MEGDLLRDDLGRGFERAMNVHYENVYARQAPAGEYVVNLHMYASYDATLPIAVEVTVEIVKRQEEKVDIKKILTTTINLVKVGQEITVVRFRMNGDGDLIENSIREDPYPLREAR